MLVMATCPRIPAEEKRALLDCEPVPAFPLVLHPNEGRAERLLADRIEHILGRTLRHLHPPKRVSAGPISASYRQHHRRSITDSNDAGRRSHEPQPKMITLCPFAHRGGAIPIFLEKPRCVVRILRDLQLCLERPVGLQPDLLLSDTTPDGIG